MRIITVLKVVLLYCLLGCIYGHVCDSKTGAKFQEDTGVYVIVTQTPMEENVKVETNYGSEPAKITCGLTVRNTLTHHTRITDFNSQETQFGWSLSVKIGQPRGDWRPYGEFEFGIKNSYKWTKSRTVETGEEKSMMVEEQQKDIWIIPPRSELLYATQTIDMIFEVCDDAKIKRDRLIKQFKKENAWLQHVNPRQWRVATQNNEQHKCVCKPFNSVHQTKECVKIGINPL